MKPVRRAVATLLALLLAWALVAAPALAAPRVAGSAGRPRVAGAIDQGSMSTKLVVIDHAGKVLAEREITTKLGRNLGLDRLLPAANRERGVVALRSLVRTARRFGLAPADLDVISTAAVRNARGPVSAAARKEGKKTGREYVADDVIGRLGLTRARVLSGPAEARLGYEGAILPLRATAPPRARFLVLDFGGGSHQATLGTASRVLATGSTQVGFNQLIDELLVDEHGQALDTLPPGTLATIDRALAAKAPTPPLDAARAAGATAVLSGGVGRYLALKLGRETVTRGELEALRAKLEQASPRQRGRVLNQGANGRPIPLGDRKTVGLGERGSSFRDERVSFVATLSLVLHTLSGYGVDRPDAEIRLTRNDARHALALGRLAH